MSDFRIPGHDCVTLISCSRSPAVTTLIMKFKERNVTKKHFERKKYYMGIQLVLPQSRSPALGKKNILHGYTTSAPAVPRSHTRKKKRKKYYTGIQLVLPQSRSPAVPHSAHGL